MLCWEKSSTFCAQSIDIDPLFMWDGTMFIVSTINILVKNWVKLAGLLKKTIGERGKFKKKLECYKAK